MAVITPTWDWVKDYILQSLPYLNNIVDGQGGMTEIEIRSGMEQGDTRIRMPFVTDLSNTLSSMTQVTSSSTITPTSLATTVEYGAKLMRQDGISWSKYYAHYGGVQPLNIVRNQIVPFINREIQTSFKSVLNGVFGSALATSHTNDISESASPYLSSSAIIDTKTKLGDYAPFVTKMYAPSALLTKLYELGMQELTDNTDVNSGGIIRTLAGCRVYINDTICASYTHATSGETVYPIYLAADSPLYLAFNDNTYIAADEDPATAGGTDKLYFSVFYTPHVKGVSYTSTTDNPDNDDLATTSSWTKRTSINNTDIKILRLVVKKEV